MLPMSKQASGGFSIDSIINTTRRETSREDSPLSRNNVDNPRPNLGTRSELSAINGRIPPLHPALPLHVRNLLLGGETTRSLPPDVFHYGQSWPLHNSSLPSISTLARSLPQYTEPCLNAGFPGLWPQVSEQMAFLNPWLVTRGTQSLLGLPLGNSAPGLFFQPYRKPKRIRTAFSPSQLLKLEKVFERNHYVVGQERKDLATNLNLSETQVKVWFQNRRTKYKRVKVGDESELEDQPGSSKDHECEEIYGNLNVTENTDDESDNDENS
eukprot:XP_011414573.1 PREDICTED: homeobox protein EMX2 [Crassostrea gigas]